MNSLNASQTRQSNVQNGFLSLRVIPSASTVRSTHTCSYLGLVGSHPHHNPSTQNNVQKDQETNQPVAIFVKSSTVQTAGWIFGSTVAAW